MAVDDLRSGTWVTYVGGKAHGIRFRRSRIEIVHGPDKGTVVELEAPIVRIGARRGNDVQLSDSKVSGVHCEIHLEESGYRLRDLDSTNGTFVGGYRIREVFVPPGTQVTVGGTRLVFVPLDDSIEVPLSFSDRLEGMVGRSVQMRELFARIEKLAPSTVTVLISGETGTGKELVSEALHRLSPRAQGAFVVLDCGSIPQHLIESELFGHERGAFTGAVATRKGAFERADGGTLFLDEVGELPPSVQPRLLRVLESKVVRRVGGGTDIPIDIRVVAATNRDLGVEVNRGRFREDLFYRLAVTRLHVPALRDRREDLPLLVKHFLAETPGARPQLLEADTIAMMKRHDWPGNVRELRNVIERAVLLNEIPESGSDTGNPQPTPSRSTTGDVTTGSKFVVSVDIGTPFKVAKQVMVSEFERRYITMLLDEHEGNISSAARAAGIDRMSIHKMLNRLGIAKP